MKEKDNRKLVIAISEEGRNVLGRANEMSKPINKSLKKATSAVGAKVLHTELKNLRKALEQKTEL